MKISQSEMFYVNDYPVSCDIEIVDGLNILTGRNGIGKTTFFQYIKTHAKDIFPGKVCAFMDQFPLKPIIELRGVDVLNILNEDTHHFNLEKVNELIETFEFFDLITSKIENYSGGENQIFKFILLMGQTVDLYFLDEPLQYLDDRNIEKLLSQLAQMSDKKIVMIEHRQEKLTELSFDWIEMKEFNQSIFISSRVPNGKL